MPEFILTGSQTIALSAIKGKSESLARHEDELAKQIEQLEKALGETQRAREALERGYLRRELAEELGAGAETMPEAIEALALTFRGQGEDARLVVSWEPAEPAPTEETIKLVSVTREALPGGGEAVVPEYAETAPSVG